MELLELEITNVAHGGIFVARHEGRVVFVSDAIDGERVVARVTDTSQKKFWRAETVEVLTASKHRKPHVWAEADISRDPDNRVGGAEFGHIELAHQRALKAFVIEDSLHRFGGTDAWAGKVAVQALPGDDESAGTGWRTRVRLHVDDEGRVGPYASRSHRVIEVGSLPLAVAELNELAPLTQRINGAFAIDLIAPSADRARVTARMEGARDKQVIIRERVGEREFRLAEDGFWQVHRHAATTLTDAVSRAIDADRFDVKAANHDLYGGVGLLAAAMGDRFGSTTRMVSVESNESATEFAAHNLADWVGARAITARVDHYLRDVVANTSEREAKAWSTSTVVLDPPRSGAGRDVVDALGKLAPEQVIYVACDPVALARDVKYFAAHGYSVEHLEAFDLFPNTHHVETVVRLGKQ